MRVRSHYLAWMDIPVWRERMHACADVVAQTEDNGLAQQSSTTIDDSPLPASAHVQSHVTQVPLQGNFKQAPVSGNFTQAQSAIMTEALPPPAALADWQAFETKLKTCQFCDLCQTRTQVVTGVGPKTVDLCIIGEAPGRDEDKQGAPFVGRAGQLLTQMLAAIGLPRENVYITNILKCRPPGNRDPKPEEIAACLPHLMQQLEWLQPKVLLLLGRIAAQTLLQTQSPMRSLRAQTLKYNNQYTTVVTYHPAYLLRNPADKAKALEDLILLRQLLAKTPT